MVINDRLDKHSDNNNYSHFWCNTMWMGSYSNRKYIGNLSGSDYSDFQLFLVLLFILGIIGIVFAIHDCGIFIKVF